MNKPKVYLFTSPTCPSCHPAKKFIHEFKKKRDDFVLYEMMTNTSQGQKKAQEFRIRGVPTFIILGDGYPDPIGLVGVQNSKTMNKYLNFGTFK